MRTTTFWFWATFIAMAVNAIIGNAPAVAAYSAAMCVMMYLEALEAKKG